MTLRGVGLVSVAMIALVGCAAEAESEEAVSVSESVTESCGARYGEALAHYNKAVAYSKERLAAGNACQTEHGYLWEIADEASRAVMVCGAFRETIRTSPWAAPLRQVLAPSLNLKSYTGELLVIRDSSWANWTGVENLIPGTSFWAQAAGAYGSTVRVDFYANGGASWGFLQDDGDGNVAWRSQPATYVIESPSGLPQGRRTIEVTHGGVVENFTLNVQNPASYNDAPLFVLVPSDNTASPALYSLVSECSA